MRSDAARNRDRILEVARTLIAREGASVSMDAIAAEAGVAVGTLYRHHPTKAALVEAVVEHSIEQIATTTREALLRIDAGADAAAELDATFRLVAEHAAADAAVKQAAESLGTWSPLTLEPAAMSSIVPGSAMERALLAVQDLLAAALATGRVRQDLTIGDLWVLLAGVPDASAPPELRDRYIDIVLAGLRT